MDWVPSREWEGQDAYVVGGGPSLRFFDWGLLRGKNTVGCNSAFLLGVDVVKIVVFGDLLWWEKIGRAGTEGYGGRVVGCVPGSRRVHPQLQNCPWLLTMGREESKDGLGLERLGWNGNTGSLALNLALILGARRVYLLGFDMKLGRDSEHNWHDLRYEPGTAYSYRRFISQFGPVARDLPAMFPGRGVWNVTDDSDLDCFPKQSLEAHFGKEVVWQR